jgi:C-terminal processing protease CtpA/Prc
MMKRTLSRRLMPALGILGLAACGGGGGGTPPGSGATVPGAPVISSAGSGDGSITLSFAPPPVTGGSPITGYTATCSSGGGGRSANGSASPLTVAGLANGSEYRCTVAAINAAGTGGPSAAVTATPGASGACALRDRQQWALATLREWYLFPETLPTGADPSGQPTVQGYIDALTATARGQGRDRYFTYLTSIAEENAFYGSGATAGFGFRISTDADRRVFITEAFEDAPALAAGIDRGDEIVAIGDTPANLRTVADIIATSGSGGVTAALGPSNAGVTRTLRVSGAAGTREVTLTKADFALSPVSSRYGAQVIEDGARRIGYVNLRTFISSADPQLRAAFERFRAQGITEFVVDLRYNGGGLVSVGELLGDLLGGNRSPSEVLSHLTYRPEKSSNNVTRRFAPQTQSVAAVKIAFIATGATASASEFVINGFIPYLGPNLGLIGANTYGKPVGQIAVDRSACDDRLRVVAFSTRNAANSDSYFNGLAGSVGASCQAADDLGLPLGDPREASVRQALDFLAGRSCTPIAAGTKTAQSVGAKARGRELLVPADPTVPQREVPGSF